MANTLISHALTHVWCSPGQDRQFIFKPARLTHHRGVRRVVEVEWQTLTLPDQTNKYHVYQIGQLHPDVLGMTLTKGVWYSLTNICNADKLLADVYIATGQQYPRFCTYVRWMNDRNLIIAVRDLPTLMTLPDNALYLRVYSNAYLGLSNPSPFNHRVVTEGFIAQRAEEILLLQRRCKDYNRTGPGHAYLFQNGYLVDDIPPDRSQVGDILELVYDTTIEAVMDLPISELRPFDSELDDQAKYLLHPPGKDDRIFYQDDVDVYLLDKSGSTFKGVWVHKNREDTLRMVTHRDYALSIREVQALAETHPGDTHLNHLTVRLHRRQGGYDRRLVYEHHRLHELYRLDDNRILDAMLNDQGSVSVWRASALEASGYTQVMRSLSQDVDIALVERAYGYNAISKLIADTPSKGYQVSGFVEVDVPTGLQKASVAYEFDAQGNLLGFYQHLNAPRYIARNETCVLVEMVVGYGDKLLPTVYDQPSQPLDPEDNYRFYISGRDGLLSDGQWEDVTDQEGVAYLRTADGVEWLLDQKHYYTAVRSDRDILAFEQTVTKVREVVRFSITATENQNGQAVTLPLQIPLGQLEVWLNGYALIENLDYFCVGPEVVVTAKHFLVSGQDQQITVRARGFCQKDLSRQPVGEIGFVEHGMLSRDAWYDVRDDKVVRIIGLGKTLHRSDLVFAEDQKSIVVDGLLRNGAPYQVTSPVIPLQGIVPTDTYTLKAQAEAVDEEIENYLTVQYPQPNIDRPSAIPEYYQIYSPFLGRIVSDLKSGQLAPEGMEGIYDDDTLRKWLKVYEDLLPFDPVLNGVDRRYVSIHPISGMAVIELTIYQFELLDRACASYLGGKVDLNPFVVIKQGLI